MDRENVKKILFFYRDIDKEIAFNQRELNEYEDRYYSMNGGGTLDGMPKSKYKISSPVETVALNIPDSASAVMRDLRENIERLSTLKIAIFEEINNLSFYQKSILYDFYIRGLQWVQISRRTSYSGTQCKNIRNRALENLGRQFAKIPLIANFNYPL